MRINLLIFFVAAPGLLLAQTPDLSATWLSDSDGAVKWILTQKPGEIQVQELNGDRVEANFTCPLNGNTCSVKENSRAEKVMMYFNGDKLVEIRERGNDAIKQRLTVSADGKTLTVETVPLDSNQKANKTSFRRQAVS
jgi:hypothetical protein